MSNIAEVTKVNKIDKYAVFLAKVFFFKTFLNDEIYFIVAVLNPNIIGIINI